MNQYVRELRETLFVYAQQLTEAEAREFWLEIASAAMLFANAPKTLPEPPPA